MRALLISGFREVSFRWGSQGFLCTLVLIGTAFLVVYPLLAIVVISFETSQPGELLSYSLTGWQSAFQSPAIVQSILTTLHLTWWRQIIAMPVALLFVWLIARTDLPGRDYLEFTFWVAFFLPTLTVVQGYLLMFDPQYGIVNKLLAKLPFFGPSTIDIYSFHGIIFAHLATNAISAPILLLTPVFRNMDASLEEAAQVSGSSVVGTFLRITIPLMAPGVLVVFLLSTIRAMETFEIEMFLGAPKNIYVYSMQVYDLVRSNPPRFSTAAALSVMVLLLIAPLVIAQMLVTRKSFTTVGSRYRAKIIRLGAWRRPAFALVAGTALFTTVVPTLLLFVGTLMELWGFFDLPNPWTLRHWETVLSDPIFIRSLLNTVTIATGVALLGVVWGFIVAYIVVRTRFRARYVMDFVSWLPFALPGVILGLGFLRPMYGTVLMLIVALTVSAITSKIQVLRSNLVQIHGELEEAARAAGNSWLGGIRTVTVPLVFRGVLVVGILGFMSASRNVSIVALLSSSSNRPLSMLQLDYLTEGRYEAAAVVGTILVLLTVVVAFLVRVLGFRKGVQTSE